MWEKINTNPIKPSIETPVVTSPRTNYPETMRNKNIENYIDEKYDETAMSHLKQQILRYVEIAIKSSIDSNTKNEIVSCLQSHILLS